ncbi:hypothetical protein A9Z40_03110 [Microbacterium arborescens]|uniref:Uncharacterized protein n=1 Tax=Microbacterium arborescens TaxID=33883 RepID=A0ABX2WIL4_9MICO|nr:hypothetical protein [Microbacterium arborescens]OAZ40944.1 hypothetical protein A9Z40_03110 [Microbacterium arborescens]
MLKLYSVTIGGIDHTMQLDEHDAERLGRRHEVTLQKPAKAAPAAPRNKARKPSNKAAKPAAEKVVETPPATPDDQTPADSVDDADKAADEAADTPDDGESADSGTDEDW